MPSFCSRNRTRKWHCIYLSETLGLCWSMTVHSSPSTLFLMAWTVLRSCGQVIYRMSLLLTCLMFLLPRLDGGDGLGRTPLSWGTFSFHHTRVCAPSPWPRTGMLGSPTELRWCLPGTPHPNDYLVLKQAVGKCWVLRSVEGTAAAEDNSRSL